MREIIALQARCEGQMRLDVCSGCSECWLRCAHDVTASRREWEQIQAHLASLTDNERQEIAHVEAQNKAVDLGDDVTVAMCRWFDMTTRRCAVYPVRPLACRLLGHVEWMPCPIERVPARLPTPLALELMQAYAREERRPFADWESSVPPDES